MEEKYITKLLNFSSDIMCNAKELIITKEQAKGIIKELEQDYVPKAIIKLEIKKLENKQEEMTRKKHNTDNINDCYLYGDEAQKAMYQKEVLEELLGR